MRSLLGKMSLLFLFATPLSGQAWATQSCLEDYKQAVGSMKERNAETFEHAAPVVSTGALAGAAIFVEAAPIVITSGVLAVPVGVSSTSAYDVNSQRDMEKMYAVLLQAELGDGLELLQLADDLETKNVKDLSLMIREKNSARVFCTPELWGYADLVSYLKN